MSEHGECPLAGGGIRPSGGLASDRGRVPTVFQKLDDLDSYLRVNGVETSKWGQGPYKSVLDLWQEVVVGEATLLPGPLRVVAIAVLEITQNGYVLLEKEQMLRGVTRHWGLMRGEKVAANETIRDGVVRGLRQELGLREGQYEISGIETKPEVVVTDSASYPGLRAVYLKFIVRVETSHLSVPPGEFVTDEVDRDIHDPVTRHVWGWRKKEVVT